MLKLRNFEIKAQVLCCDKIVNLYHVESNKDHGMRFDSMFDSWSGGKPEFDENSDEAYNICPVCGTIYRFNHVLTAEHPDNFIIITENS